MSRVVRLVPADIVPARRHRSRASSQRGGAALVLLLVLSGVAALVGAMAIRGSVSDVKVAGAMRTAKSAFYCAEAGINASRTWFGNNYTSWNAIFDPALADPAGYPVTGDIDGDGVIDYQVTLRDNIDEFPTPNALADNDLTAIMVSTCVNPTMGARTLQEIVTANAHGTNYRYQAGHGSNHAGTEN